MQAAEFLGIFWTGWAHEGSVTVWAVKDGESSICEHLPVKEVLAAPDTFDAELAEWAGDRNCYFHPGLRREGLTSFQRGGKKDVIALAGFGLDVDVLGGVHSAKNLPTEEDLPRLLEVGPDPTLVVSTGGGLHLWWLFPSQWDLRSSGAQRLAQRAFQEFQAPFLARAKEMGLHIDNTAGIERQWRLPGTKNWKAVYRGESEIPTSIDVVYQSDSRLPITTATRPRPSPLKKPRAKGDDPLGAVRKWMKRRAPSSDNKGAFESILQGESFAERGSRNETMQSVISTIAWSSPARELEPEVLVELLRPVFEIWANEPDSDTTVEREIGIATNMFERAIADWAEDDAREQEGIAIVARGMNVRLSKSSAVGGSKKDTKQEVVVEAVAHEEDIDKLIHSSIVQYQTDYFVHNFALQEGTTLKLGYYGSYKREFLQAVLNRFWVGAPRRFSVTYENAKGEQVIKTHVRIIQDYVTPALEVVGDLMLQESYLDFETSRFHRALCPFRVTEAVFDPGVDEWLRVLAGEKAEQLLDWLACVPKLDRENCALYLEGPPGAGKSGILGRGIARLWRESGPSSLSLVLSTGNNSDIFRCPLVLLDEGPPAGRASQQTSFAIRSLIGSSDHTYREKWEVSHKVTGCVRVLIAANNDQILLRLANEDLGEVDVEAMVNRFLHIKATREAADWIQEANSIDRGVIDSWIEGDLLAKHVLWLAQTREVKRGKRFMVDGEASEMHRTLVTRGDRAGFVLEWVARFVMDPDRITRFFKTKKMPTFALCGNGQILVNTQGVVECWSEFRKPEKNLSPVVIGRVLHSLSSKTRQLGSRGERIKYYVVKWDNVRQVAEDLQFDVMKMEANVNREAKFDPDPDPEPRLQLVRGEV